MRLRKIVPVIAITATVAASPVRAQTPPTGESVIQRIWQEGMENSQTERLARSLLDSIGPRLAGSPGFDAAGAWLLDTYEGWGIPARKEEYGTWIGWRQGILHVDLLEPRVRTLEAHLMAYSPGTNGAVEGEVVQIPAYLSEDTVEDWLASIGGKYVLTSPPEPMCRAAQELVQYARSETVERVDSLRAALRTEYNLRLRALGGRWHERERRLEEAGAAGILSLDWSGGWGVNKVHNAATRAIPSVDLSCEDYGLLFRLSEGGRGPRIRVSAEAEDLGEVPQFNVIAELRGTELPDEYVLLSAHLDSWHSASGATDNGTGTIMMAEAMRLLKAAYPEPRRTILVGHWGAEEMGLIGSRSFVEDHPEVVEGLQAAFNQDNGTWRIEIIEGQGFLRAGERISAWLGRVPTAIGADIERDFPGLQDNRSSDHSSFVCAGAPAFRLQAPYDEYRQYTWHTNRDTYDKIVFDDLRQNATLAAMLAYAASEDTEMTPRDQSVLIDRRTGVERPWMRCGTARRTPPEGLE